MQAFVAEDIATAAPVPYPLYRPQAAPLIADDCANTYAELGASLKAYPSWVRGVVADPDEAKNGLYVCVTADPDQGTSTWHQLITLELLQWLAPTLFAGAGASGKDGKDGRDGLDGQPGQPGADGKNGKDGATGADGAPGKAGATILLGTGAPGAGLGVAGDLYLNTATWELFAKSVTAWNLQGSLKGSDGVAGADGISPQLLHGTGNPAPTLLAQPGAWFLNTLTGELFEYQLLTSWTSLTVLKGDQGAQGVPGTSAQFRFGASIPSGAVGVDGDGYLDTDSYNLYARSGGAWVLKGNLRGPAGADGAVAARLRTYVGAGQPAAALGNNDDLYLNQSDNGLYVKSGNAWALALQLQGAQGPSGAAGAAGAKWFLVQGLPADSVGTAGDVALNTVTGVLYVRGTTSWADTGASLRGAQGAQGDPGPVGIGSRIYAGASAPGAGLGVVTDFYIQYNGLLFEKTSATTWTSRGQLQFSGSGSTSNPSGSTSTGTSRVLFYYGAGHPDTNTDLPTGLPDGSVYVDQDAGDLYSLVTAGWQYVLHLKGDDGQAGAQGLPGQSVTGQQGPAGKDGKDGKNGADGLPGSTLLHRYGLGAPSSQLGVNGETYTDISSAGWDYYQKSNNNWSKLGILKGPKGDPGARILYLGSDPGTSDGAVGDTAINSTSGDVFEKTAASAWTKRGNMKGPKGDKGDTGTTEPGGTGTGTSSGSTNGVILTSSGEGKKALFDDGKYKEVGVGTMRGLTVGNATYSPDANGIVALPVADVDDIPLAKRQQVLGSFGVNDSWADDQANPQLPDGTADMRNYRGSRFGVFGTNPKSIKWYLCLARPVTDGNGTVTGAVNTWIIG